MTGPKPKIMAASEALARERGADSLTVREIARRANYGKSTVHEVLGSVDSLRVELRDRALRDLLASFATPEPLSPGDPDACHIIPDRLAAWVLENPAWASVAFSTTGLDNVVGWVHPIVDWLRDAFPDLVAQLTDDDVAELAGRSARMILADIPTVVALGREYGEQILTETVRSIYSSTVALITLRSREADADTEQLADMRL